MDMDTNTETKYDPNWGGRRENSGRKRQQPALKKSIGLRLPLDVYDFLQMQGNKSAFVEKLIREYCTNNNIIL